MNLINDWVRFTWDLTTLPAFETELPEHYQVGQLTGSDEKELRKVISSSFVLDPTWNPAMNEVTQIVGASLDRAFQSADTSVCLALRHGLRIIGASVLSLDPESESNLSPGPCVLVEYRNRGFGTRLLEHSLRALRDAGLARAIALTRGSAPVAKFLYPKYQGVALPAEVAPLLAA
jgi:hypothetical protein